MSEQHDTQHGANCDCGAAVVYRTYGLDTLDIVIIHLTILYPTNLETSTDQNRNS